MSGYERRDLRISAIAKTYAGLAVVAAIVAIAAFATLRGLSRPPSPSVARVPPPEPRLQADPAADLRAMRAEEDAELEACAWTDRPRGLIRVPIERAMTLLLLRGLPTRSSAARRRP